VYNKPHPQKEDERKVLPSAWTSSTFALMWTPNKGSASSFGLSSLGNLEDVVWSSLLWRGSTPQSPIDRASRTMIKSKNEWVSLSTSIKMMEKSAYNGNVVVQKRRCVVTQKNKYPVRTTEATNRERAVVNLPRWPRRAVAVSSLHVPRMTLKDWSVKQKGVTADVTFVITIINSHHHHHHQLSSSSSSSSSSTFIIIIIIIIHNKTWRPTRVPRGLWWTRFDVMWVNSTIWPRTGIQL